MNTYPNLRELIEYHPYSECTVCDHAQIEPELLHAALKGVEVLTPIEVMSIARLCRCPAGVIESPEVIMLDTGRWRHDRMVMEVQQMYMQLKCMAGNDNQKAESYLKQIGRKWQQFTRAVYENQLSYGHYFGLKEPLKQYISFATYEPKRRGLTVMKGGAL